MTSDTPPEPVERRIADALTARYGTERLSVIVRVLRRLDTADRHAYRAVADLPTPWLDEPLRRVSNFANFSKSWLLVAVALALVVTAQMLLDLVVLGLGIQVILGAVKRGKANADTETV